jgi:hypothetical protein
LGDTWVTLGWHLGDTWVTLGWHLGDTWVTSEKMVCWLFNLDTEIFVPQYYYLIEQ